MCRSIHKLHNIDPPATQEEIHEASLQFVRKVSGYRKPSRGNEVVFTAAVHEIEASVTRMLISLESRTPAINRITMVDEHA